MPWYPFVHYQLQDALGVCKLTTGENSAPLLTELLRGTNAADISNNFRQRNFLSLAPGLALHESSQWMPSLPNESSFGIDVGNIFLYLYSYVAVIAKYCWPSPSASESWQLGFFGCLPLVCRLWIRPGYLLSFSGKK